MTEISELELEFLQELSDTTTIKIGILEKDYTKFYEAIKDEPEFEDPEELKRYLELMMRAKFQSRPPTKPRQIIPIGMDQIRKAKKSGDIYSSLYVIDIKKDLRRITFNADVCDKLHDIQLFYPYKDVELTEYSKSNDFLADDRSDFSKFVDKKLDIESVLELTKAKKLTLSEILTTTDKRKIKENLSKVDDQGWSIKTDWRAIHGMVENIKLSEEDTDGTNSGWLSLTDNSINVSKELFDKKGVKIRKNIRVWTSPLVAGNITKYSECWILGPLGQNPKTGEITMNGFCVLLTRKSPIDEE